MALGVLLHSLCGYLSSSRIPEFPLYDGTTFFAAADGIVLWIHSFRMPLFFLISGFFFARTLDLKADTNFLKKRIQRLLVPFLFCLLTLLPIFRWLIGHLQSVQDSQAFTMSYLWFLYDLCWITIFAYVLRNILTQWSLGLTQLGWVFFLFLLFWLTTGVAFVSDSGVLPTSDTWIPNFALLGLHTGYYVLGMTLWRRQAPVSTSKPLFRWSLPIILFLISTLYLFGVQKIYQGSTHFLWWVSGVHGILTIGLCLWLFYCFFELKVFRPRLASTLGQSSYTIYLIHPLFLAILIPLGADTPFDSFGISKPFIFFLVSLLASLGVYRGVVQTTALRRFI